MHICFVSLNIYTVIKNIKNQIGGAEIQLWLIAQELVKHNITVSIITNDFGQDDNIVVNGVNIYKIYKPTRGLPLIRFIHPNATSLWSKMKEVDANIYYLRCASADSFWISKFCNKYKKLFIYGGASDSDFSKGNEFIEYFRDKVLYRIGLKNSTHVIVQNEAQKKLVKNNFGLNSSIIGNFYKFIENAGNQKGIEKPVILWVSTIRKLKQPEIFISLAKNIKNADFIMVGGPGKDKEYFNIIKEKAKEAKNLTFHGFVNYDDTEKIFDSSTLFINTSKFEGFPNTFLQAWARKIPVISFVSPENDNIVLKATNKEDMINKIHQLINDKNRLSEIADKSYSYFFENYTVEKNITKYINIFKKLMRT